MKQEIDALLHQADEADEAHYGKKRLGDELPDELSQRASRLQKIREAKQALENEANEKTEHERTKAEKERAEREEE
jgi:hypothetical protein